MPRKSKITWVLVADGAKARILERRSATGPLVPAPGQCFAEAEARKSTRDIGADRPGRVQESANAARHSMEPRVDWHRFAKEQFARKVADALEQAAMAHKFDSLLIVAPPQALGDLRAAMGSRARALVESEVGKDLTGFADHEIRAHLR